MVITKPGSKMKRNEFSIPIILLICCIIISCSEKSINPPVEELNDITSPPSNWIGEPKLAINSQGDYFISNSKGIFRSTNEGNTWDTLPLSINGLLHTYEIKITDDDIIFTLAIFVSSGSRMKILRSTNNGNSWTELSLGNDWLTSIEKDSDNNIYVCGNKVYKSTNYGDTWEEIYSEKVSAIGFPRDSIVIIGIREGNYGRVLYSDNNGISWQSTNNFNELLSFYKNDSTMYAGTNNNRYSTGGILKSTDWGRSWEQSGLSGRTPVYSFITNSLNQVLCASTAGIFLTADDGASWQDALADSSVSSLIKDKNGYLYTITARGTFLRSTDNGMSWHD
jgi:photosystem II stability/assembly factor-like uncharacterized protein